MNEVTIQFFTNSKVKRYLELAVQTGLYGQTIAEAAERIIAERIAEMVLNAEIEEIAE